MSGINDIAAIGARILRLAARVPGLLIMTGARYRQFRRSFLAEATAMGIPPDAAGEMLDGLKPGRLYRALRGTGGEGQAEAADVPPGSADM